MTFSTLVMIAVIIGCFWFTGVVVIDAISNTSGGYIPEQIVGRGHDKEYIGEQLVDSDRYRRWHLGNAVAPLLLGSILTWALLSKKTGPN